MTLNTNNHKDILDENRVIENLALRQSVSTDIVTILEKFWIWDENSWIKGYFLQINWHPTLYEAIINENGEIIIQ